jgi:hypothetical protein
MYIEQRKHCVEDGPADILEIEVDAVRDGLAELRREGGVTPVDAGIEAEFVHHISTLIIASRNADHTATFDFGDLADNRSDRAACRGDDHGFAGLGLTDL